MAKKPKANKKNPKDQKKNKKPSITIDAVEYSSDKLTEAAKAQLDNIEFVDQKIQQLQNELAVANTAGAGYRKAFSTSVAKPAHKA